ncbi:MAG TPA: glycoside hydrolase family 2 TIM barrel-domain containing protein [Stellaceae bacterium]|nr:glycoside hydrolase family 2 TIM barrel-domain containing protein [Stellaceae bacterium]
MRREMLSLDGRWDFAFCGDKAVSLDAVEAWRECTVPSPWQAEFADLRERTGRAWYRRSFELPQGWLDGGAVLLRFGAVNYHAVVFLNGVEIGRNEGGYLPFAFDIAGTLRPGPNELAVLVTAPTDDPALYPEYPFAEIPFGKQSWYGPLAGIWQPVSLERRARDHIRQLRIFPHLADGSVRLEIEFARPLPRDHALDVEIIGPEGRLVAAANRLVMAAEDQARLRITVPEALSWSPERPRLYRLVATLRQEDDLRDEVGESFGFRTIEMRDGRILLNGEPIYLRAALDQDYYPDGICTPPSEAFIEDQFRKAKELGLNCLRCHIKVPDPRYYAVADRLGLLVWSELPNTGRLTDKSAARLEATLRGIVARDGNHPSIICWTIINENWGIDLVHDETHRAWLRRTYRWLKALDPTRLVVDNSPCPPNIHVESDLHDFHYYAAIPDHRAAWDGFVERLAARPDWTYSAAGDARRSGDEPLICSEFGNWGLPDPDALKDAAGREPWWFETGHDWGEGVMYPHGVEHRFRAAGLDRVFGSLRKFVEAAQWQQYRALKYQIEAMRRRPEIAGYVITEFTDCHWESNGLLDMRRNPRVFHHALSAVNADTVIVPRWERLAYWSGEAVAIALAVAEGGGRRIAEAELRWSLDAAGCGGREAIRLEPGAAPAGAARFTAPAVLEPEIHRIEFELDSASGILATNHLDLAVFPARDARRAAGISVWSPEDALRQRFGALGYVRAATPESADLIVAQSLDDRLAGLIRQGARALLLCDAAMELQPVFPHWQQVRAVPRQGSMWLGAWASSFSWLRREGPFARIPGGPLIDHAFDRVIPNHVIAGCNSWDFQARVHAGIVVGWIHKPAALIVERDYGRGRLVATTFRLTEDAPGADPTATTLLDALAELAQRPAPARRERREKLPLPA